MGKHKATLASVKDYYGKILQGSKDLKTSACCSIESFPPAHRAILTEIDSEILDRFYSSWKVLASALRGSRSRRRQRSPRRIVRRSDSKPLVDAVRCHGEADSGCLGNQEL
jgi:hypothetical protein